MTTARLRSRMRRIAADEDDVEGGELNLVPFLDIVTNIILFLFITLSFNAALASVPVRAPVIDRDGRDGNGGKGKEELALTLAISELGFTLAYADGVYYQGGVPGRVPTLPKLAGELDYAGLTRITSEIKRAHPGESVIHITADDGIPYEQVIGAIDAVRGTPTEPLFTIPQFARIGDEHSR